MDVYTKFSYSVKSYDEDNKTIDVEYDDGSWARISFSGTIPRTGEELDLLVSQYTRHKPHMEAQYADDTFVKNMIGKSRVADRFSLAATLQPKAPPDVQAETAQSPSQKMVDAVTAYEEEWITEIINKILKEKGIFNE